MKTLADVRALSKQFSPLWERLRVAGGKAAKVLFFSLGDEAISPRRSLCVSLEKGGFSAVFGRRVLSRVSVSDSRAFPFQGYPDPADFASSLDLAAKEMGVSGVAVSIALPKAWTVIKTFSLPHSVKQNLPEVLSYEMDRITPFSSDEALYDFEILKETEEGMHIVVVAAKSEMVLPYLEALAERGFQVERVTSTVSGAGNLCLRSGWKDCIFLEISGGEYSGVVYADGMITASFSGSITGDDAAKGDQIVSELETRNQGLGKETKILVSVREQSNSVIERLRGLRGVMFVKSSDFGFGSSAADASLSSLGCLVESLWPKAMSLNLLMKGYREKKRPAFFLTAVLALAGISMAVAYTLMPLQIETKRLAEISRQIEIRKPGLKKVEGLKKEMEKIGAEVSTINGFRGKGPLNLDIMKELTAIIPKETWLTRVQINEGTVQIEGFAKTATELLPKIEASRRFRKAEFALSTVRDESMKAERFAIKMEVEVPVADEKK